MELIEDLHPHYGPEMYRVYFPLYQLGQTEPCYFVGRWIFQTTPDKPYINHPIAGTKRSEIVWGLHRFPRPKKRVVVCEGILDAIWGDDRVATLGKSVNPMQAKLIATLATDEIILMPDGDAVANAMTTLETILQFWAGPVSLIRLPFDVDPGDLHEDIDMSKRERLV